MRRVSSLLALLVAVPAAVTILPVLPASPPTAHAVAPVVRHLALSSPSTGRAALAAHDTAQFRMVGLSWRHDDAITAVSAQIRVRTDGVWTPWQNEQSSDGADTNSRDAELQTRDATEPLWVGHADAVEARVISVSGPIPQGLRVDLVDPGTSAADKSAGRSASPMQSAVAATTQPPIITRAMWGADESLRTKACPSGVQYTGVPQVAFVHHTATTNAYAPGDSAAIVRSIYAYHVLSNGWCDIGYNFLVDQYGQVFEGRFGGVDKGVLGAHTGGFNTNTFGVAMIGTYSTVAPSAALTTALAQLLAWKLSLSYANPLGQVTLRSADFSGSKFPTGTPVSFNVIAAHRDADVTDCPGDLGYAILPDLRQQVLQDMGAGLVTPSATVSGRTAAANGSVRVVAGLLAAGDWQLTVQDANGITVRTIAGNGGDVDATWDMTSDSGAPVAPGVYTATLNSTQNGVTAVPWSTSVTVGGVFGSVDDAVPSGSRVDVTGWALRGVDTNPASVRVTVSSVAAGTGTANLQRTDVASLYPAYGAAHGFDVTVRRAVQIRWNQKSVGSGVSPGR